VIRQRERRNRIVVKDPSLLYPVDVRAMLNCDQVAMASSPITKVTAEEYLALDRAAEFRSEFLDGEIIAMSGGSPRHSELKINLVAEVHAALRGTSCRAFDSDLRVRVSSRMYTYPDLTVVCGKLMLADERRDMLLNPTAIFEVLSPSTEYYDRIVKFQHYRGIESLQDYILVAQDQIRIEQYTRGDANTWTIHDYLHAGDVLRIASIGVSLPLAAIYERIEFSAE
jgi:Uma2 family endonuclease